MSMIENQFLYPVALNISRRNCVVVGGGTVGARKVRNLADAGGLVTIVSPSLCEEATILVTEGRAKVIQAVFIPAHLENSFLVVAATNNPVVNAEISRIASARNILVNKATSDGNDTETGDFVTMATLRRGDLMIAVTSAGAGPALSAQLRREFAERFGPEWESVVALLGEMRVRTKQTLPDETDRTRVLRQLASQAERLAELFRSGEAQKAREEAQLCLHP